MDNTSKHLTALLKLLLLALCLNLLTGCSDSILSSPDADVFQGLDPTVVSEVLANPTVRTKIERRAKDEQPGLAQGIVINFIVCRDMLRVYQEWQRSGVPPKLQPLPHHANPDPITAESWELKYSGIKESADSGDPENLRDWLIGEGRCGEWIPAQPGDISGPTIEDVVLGRI